MKNPVFSRDLGKTDDKGKNLMACNSGGESKLLRTADLPLEVVILLVGGMALLITGALLLPVSAGALPFYENGLYGLLLVIFALQTITMGKTPFGDAPRSLPLLAAGVMIAAVGIVACFIPTFDRLPRILLLLCLGPGGLFLLLRMCLDQDKLSTWRKYGGIFRHLILGGSAVYGLSMLTALLLWKTGPPASHFTAAALLLYGAAVVYLAGVLRKIYRAYPSAEKRPEGDIDLSTDQSMLLLISVFMLLLGLLLIPVNLGLLPFSGSAQLGLLMVIFAVQMLASGNTPIGPFPRSWLIIAFGFLFAALGIVSCIIAGILVPALTVLVGVLNILGGGLSLAKIRIPRLDRPAGSVHQAPLAKLFAAQLTLNLLAMAFGMTMLIPNMVHGLLVGVILAANGCVLLYLLRILVVLDRIRREMAGAR